MKYVEKISATVNEKTQSFFRSMTSVCYAVNIGDAMLIV